jgi:hypothetical protein
MGTCIGRVQDTECRKHGTGDRIQGARYGGGHGYKDAGCRIQSAGYRV